MSSSDNRWKKGQRVSKKGEYGTLIEDEDDDGKVKAIKDDGKKWNRADKDTFVLHREIGGLTSNSIHQQSKDAEVTKLIDEVASLKINNDDQNNIEFSGKLKIPIRTLDEQLSDFCGNIKLLKVDVEGYE